LSQHLLLYLLQFTLKKLTSSAQARGYCLPFNVSLSRYAGTCVMTHSAAQVTDRQWG